LLPDAPPDTFYHIGFGDGDRRTVLLVIPSLDVVATISAHRDAYAIGNDYLSEPVATVNEWISTILAGIRN
jgi:hypothetical protein